MVKKCFLFLFLIFAVQVHAAPETQKKKICLNMIVKDESEVIERCLESVKHLIDYWVIVDTGSTDGTQKVIKKFMKDVPGELHERKWIDFAHNRNEALELAKDKGDYLLMIDADEILEYAKDFVLPPLDKDFYNMTVRQLQAVDFRRTALINNHLNWKWEGVLHETLKCSDAQTHEKLEGVINICNGVIGGRSKISQREKYLKDAKVFEAALKNEPDNSRYTYYLGQSYEAADEFALAKIAFEKRIAMKSADAEETYMAIYRKGNLEQRLDAPETAIQNYFQAYAFRPTRAEPLFRIATLYRKQGNLLLGYLLSKYALSIFYPREDTVVEYEVYDHQLLIEFANCALLLGKNQEGLDACTKLLANPRLPEAIKPQVLSNYELAKTRLGYK